MKYVSTRGGAPRLGFEEALLAGLARDGGLYVPEAWPRFAHRDISAMAGLDYQEVAFRVVRPFVAGAFSDGELRAMIEGAYGRFGHAARCPLVQIGTDLFLLELFHGPTLAFKDVALQLVGRMFDAVLKRRGERVSIVGATSGDTGSAAIEAFRGSDAADVFILYPEGRVSEIQRRQMTTPSEPNVHAIAVKGDFDDCQARVKDLFNDAEFRRGMRPSAVNSINWARIMGQIVYYFTAAVALGAPCRPVGFTVPTGNFGDIYSGYAARRMGLPIGKLVIATNQNDILHRALESGDYRKEGVKASISPSMDIQVSSNFERAIFDAEGRDPEAVRGSMESLRSGRFGISAAALSRLREEFGSGRCSESETMEAIRQVRDTAGRIVCPHTAVGVKVAKEFADGQGAPMVALATAHPAKFPDAVEEACGVRVRLPERLAGITELPERISAVENSLDAIKSAIAERSAS